MKGWGMNSKRVSLTSPLSWEDGQRSCLPQCSSLLELSVATALFFRTLKSNFMILRIVSRAYRVYPPEDQERSVNWADKKIGKTPPYFLNQSNVRIHYMFEMQISKVRYGG
jgi:hypothetical protein